MPRNKARKQKKFNILKPKYLTYLLFLLIISSCHKERFLQGEKDKNIRVHFQRFDQDFNSLSDAVNFNEKTTELNAEYGRFYEIFNQGIIRLGAYNSANYNDKAQHFLCDTIYKMVYDTVQLYFNDLSTEELKLTEAFRNYKLLFPERLIPAFYTHISGFNEPIVVGDSILSVSLENYLGEDHQFYKNLGTHTYILPKKNRENLPTDAMRGWLMSEFPYEDVQSTLLNNMIHEGKYLFIQSIIMPDVPPHRLIGLSQNQYMWLEKNELNLWKFTIEQQHLFSNHQLTIAKYMQDGPFFNFFGSGSSPLVGKYLGWQIVNAYMENNKDATINSLLSMKDGQKVLQISGYKP